MALYASAPPRPSTLPESYRDVLGDIARHKSPESYLATQFLERLGRPVQWTLADSWQAFAHHFCVVDWHALDLYWPKYAPYAEHQMSYDGIKASQPLDFREWLNLYRGLGTKGDPIVYEATQGMSLGQVFPEPAEVK
jgi:hypothetical protein